MWTTANPVLRAKFIAWNEYIKMKEERSQINKLSCHVKTRKESQINPNKEERTQIKRNVLLRHCAVLCLVSQSASNSSWPHGVQHARLLCSRGFSRQEHWSGLPFPPLGDLPNPGIKPRSLTLQADSLPTEPSGKPLLKYYKSPKISEPVNCCRNLRHFNNSLLGNLW